MPFLVNSEVPTEAFTAPTTDRELQVRNIMAEILALHDSGAEGLTAYDTYTVAFILLYAEDDA